VDKTTTINDREASTFYVTLSSGGLVDVAHMRRAACHAWYNHHAYGNYTMPAAHSMAHFVAHKSGLFAMSLQLFQSPVNPQGVSSSSHWQRMKGRKGMGVASPGMRCCFQVALRVMRGIDIRIGSGLDTAG